MEDPVNASIAEDPSSMSIAEDSTNVSIAEDPSNMSIVEESANISIAEDENLKPKRLHSDTSDTENTPAKRRRIGTKPATDSSTIEKKQKDKEEKQRQREEKLEKKQKMREEKQKEKEELKKQREKKQKELEEKKQQKQKLKDQEAEKQRLLRDLKMKELADKKIQRDQEKQQKEQEKQEKEKLKEAEKHEKHKKEEEKKAKVKRQSAVFMNFFVKVKTEEPKKWGWSNDLFMPFEIKDKMSVAPVYQRNELTPTERDNLMTISLEQSDYLNAIHKLKRKRNVKDPMSAKYFHFHDNFRPPYYGTWRKTSKSITGRRPLALSHKELNYDVDSDAEWEEEQAEGGDDCLSDVEEGCDEDSNGSCDDFYVDHGYLSENEGSEASNSNCAEDSNERKRRMDQRAREFTKQNTNKRRRAVKKALNAQIYGLNWQKPQNPTHELEKRIMKTVVFDFSSIQQVQTKK